MATPADARILIPEKRWTPVSNVLLDTILPELQQRHSALLLLVLYDRAWHSASKRAIASLADLQNSTGLDGRTIAKCLTELEDEKLIRRIRSGVLRSRENLPCWRVPSIDFRLNQGDWTPVPRFLIRRYLRAYSNSVLLIVLLRIQHLRWLNESWVGVTKLCERTGWSAMRVRRALGVMRSKNQWRTRAEDLPLPLGVSTLGGRRRYRVLAVWYETAPKKGRRTKASRVMKIAKDFRERFRFRDPGD